MGVWGFFYRFFFFRSAGQFSRQNLACGVRGRRLGAAKSGASVAGPGSMALNRRGPPASGEADLFLCFTGGTGRDPDVTMEGLLGGRAFFFLDRGGTEAWGSAERKGYLPNRWA